MLGNLGFSLLLLALLTSIYGSIAAFAAAVLCHRRALRSAWVALCCELGLTVAASALLLHALLTRDFTLDYVMNHSSADLPLLYTISAFWASLAGSHLFWTLALCSVTVVAILTTKKTSEAIKPYLLGSSQLLLAWMFYSLVTHSDPFLPAAQRVEDGVGLNALLQNPYMVIHPPLLFIGYSLLVVPFLYGVAALLSGDRSLAWGSTVRRWSLAAFAVLTVAIALGGRWDYAVLGWGGYWAWDPVENSSLLPWLLLLALLHVLVLDQRRGTQPRLAVALALLCFVSTFFGTFLTSSGIVSSVHAFAKTPVGINYLWFLAILVGSSLALYGWRSPLLAARTRPPSGVREGAIALTVFVLLAFALVLFAGMLFPIAAEALTGTRLSVQAPYFNSFAPYVGMALLVLLSIKTLALRGTSRIAWGICFMLALATALTYHHFMPWYVADETVPVAASAGIFCVALCFCALGWRGARFSPRDFMRSRLRARLAGVAHLGATLAMLGFIGAYHTKNGQLTLTPGAQEPSSFGRYAFALKGPVQDRRENNAVFYETKVAIYDAGRLVGEASPALASYPTGGESLYTIVSVVPVGLMDVYLILSDWDRTNPQGGVTLSVYLNPFVQLVWAAVALMAAGGACALLVPGRKRSEG